MGADQLLYRCSYSDGTHVVVVDDLTTNTVQTVTEAPDEPWRSGSMAPNGGFVAFTGTPAGAEGAAPTDVFVFDVRSRTLDRLPRDYGGAVNRDSVSAGISIDGQTVLVSSSAPPSRPAATGEVYLFDRRSHQFTLVPSPDRLVGLPALSGDGRHVAFAAQPGDNQNIAAYVFDAGSPAPVVVSPCAPATAGADCHVGVSEDGRKVTFTASRCVDVTGVPGRSDGIFTFDRSTGTMHRDGDARDTGGCTSP
jgi:Tol biopolymer transport system component